MVFSIGWRNGKIWDCDFRRDFVTLCHSFSNPKQCILRYVASTFFVLELEIQHLFIGGISMNVSGFLSEQMMTSCCHFLQQKSSGAARKKKKEDLKLISKKVRQ